MQYTITAASGVTLLPYSSEAMNRLISVRYHTPITGGTIEIKARAPGRTDFLAVEDAPAFSAEEEKTITLAYPVAELQVTQAGITGGSLIFITVADGV
jgi:hypothetical protein